MNKYQEALDNVKAIDVESEECLYVGDLCEDDFQTLQELVDKANKYDEKEIPKKPDTYKRHIKLPIKYFCPNCNNNLYIDQKYCDKCGTKIDWKV